MNLMSIGRMSEDEARAFLESIRWPDGVVCPHCAVVGESTRLKGKSTRPGVYKCRPCRKQFTVTVGTIFHRSHIPLTTWIAAFFILCTSKKSVSALQLQRQLGLGSYKTAWHMAHRIRYAMRNGPLGTMLSGDIEADETYIGGKPRKRGKRGENPAGRGTKKTPVAALVERGGEARAKVVTRVNAATLKGFIRENADHSSTIHTDEWAAYKGIGREFEGGHTVVKHGGGEYARGNAYTNTAESFFSLLKRGVFGQWHHVSKEHLQRYVDEFCYRWTHSGKTDEDRTALALAQADGVRLTYRRPRGRPECC